MGSFQALEYNLGRFARKFFSKEFLIVWTMMNRWTWRDRGIRMNCVSPGPVESPILPDFLETLGERAKEDIWIMDHPGRPEDIAPVIAFLCENLFFSFFIVFCDLFRSSIRSIFFFCADFI